MLRMLVLGQLPGDDFRRGRADALPPVDQALRAPLAVGTVSGRHVLVHRGELASLRAAGMTGDSLPAMQQFDRGACNTGLQGLSDQRMRHAVTMQVDLDVIVDVFCGRPQKGPCVARRFLWPWR